MKLAQLIEALSRPEAYSHPVEEVQVIQTHISVVFLAGEYAYKIKKPVDLGFLDFTTLERRRHFCQEEVRLNRRGAPGIYLGVLPVTRVNGFLRFGGQGPEVEYAVHMRRLPEERTLRALLARGELDTELVTRLAERIAAFHAAAECGAHLAEHGSWSTVAFNVRENFAQLKPFIGQTISRPVYDRLARLSEQSLTMLQPLIDARAARGVTCDTHGDLHLDHIYSLPDRQPPADLLLIDCIEFNARFRYADPVSDLAFLAMDLEFHRQPRLRRQLVDAYFAAAGDDEGRALLPFYVAYRAVVRGKVESFALQGQEIPPADRQRAQARARPYMLLALGQLAPPAERPCLVLTTGLPGTGKSVLARGLARVGFEHIATDRVRKQLAGVPEEQVEAVHLEAAHYTREWTRRTYQTCLAEAEARLFEGQRVVVDGTFRQARWRQEFLDLADRWAVPAWIFVCQAPPEVVRQRLAARPPDASDADWSVYQLLAEEWEPPGIDEERAVVLDTTGPPAEGLAAAVAHLAAEGLA